MTLKEGEVSESAFGTVHDVNLGFRWENLREMGACSLMGFNCELPV